jgi:hypothetical protein
VNDQERDESERAALRVGLLAVCLGGLVDLLLAMLTVMLLLVNVQHKEEGVKLNAEYIATISWPANRDADIDIFATVPGKKNPCFWSNRQVGSMFLDHDSKGFVDDRMPDGKNGYVYLEHKEMIQIRGIFPGEYDFGIHFFNFWPHLDLHDDPNPKAIDIPIHFEISKVQPKQTVIFQKDVILHYVGDSTNVAGLLIKPDGFEIVDPPLVPISDRVYTKGTTTEAPKIGGWGDE